MASVLEHLARVGADDFYTGEIASKIVSDMEANWGLISGEDLANYETTHCDPLRGTYRGFDVATNQPPGGGVLLLQMLNVLENFDLVEMGHNSAEYLRTVTEAMKRATADKDAHIGDPAFVEVPVGRLTSKDLGREYADAIRRGERGKVERMKEAVESKSTTHVCVVDEEGNAFTMTHSLGMPSGVITEGLGFMYNGCMAVFRPEAGSGGEPGAGEEPVLFDVPDDRVQGWVAVRGYRSAGWDADHYGRAAGVAERAGLRHVDVGCGVGGAVLGDEQSD